MDGQAGRGLGMHSGLLSLRKKGFQDSGGVLSRVRLFVTLWTAARHAPLSMEVSRQEQWSGLPFPPGDPGQGFHQDLLCLLHWQVDSLPPGRCF